MEARRDLHACHDIVNSIPTNVRDEVVEMTWSYMFTLLPVWQRCRLSPQAQRFLDRQRHLNDLCVQTNAKIPKLVDWIDENFTKRLITPFAAGDAAARMCIERLCVAKYTLSNAGNMLTKIERQLRNVTAHMSWLQDIANIVADVQLEEGDGTDGRWMFDEERWGGNPTSINDGIVDAYLRIKSSEDALRDACEAVDWLHKYTENIKSLAIQ